MIDFDNIKKIDNARVELLECESSKEVEAVFTEYGIADYPPKIALLRRCMQIQETNPPDIVANDKTVYEEYLDIFLTGKLKKSGLTSKSAIPDSEDLKKHPKRSKASSDTEELCKSFNVSETDCGFFKNFFEKNIIPRIQKKYLAQLISVVEDIVEDTIEEKNRKREKMTGRHRIYHSERYRITLCEFKQGVRSKIKTRMTRVFCFPRSSFIFYNPNLDFKAICTSIAHGLGHLLQYYGVINTSDIENYAKLFTYFAIKNENSRYESGNPSNNTYQNETEIIQAIKAISSE